jgi:hypothetical protein
MNSGRLRRMPTAASDPICAWVPNSAAKAAKNMSVKNIDNKKQEKINIFAAPI